jgi:hypothetical protein
MAERQSFLDNLENLKLVMSVALEYTQGNLHDFVKNATGVQTRHAERLISQIRSLAEQLEKEFTSLERLLTKARSN